MELYDAWRERLQINSKPDYRSDSMWYEAHPSRQRCCCCCETQTANLLSNDSHILSGCNLTASPPPASLSPLRNSMSCQSTPSTYVIACITRVWVCVFEEHQIQYHGAPSQRDNRLSLFCCVKTDGARQHLGMLATSLKVRWETWYADSVLGHLGYLKYSRPWCRTFEVISFHDKILPILKWRSQRGTTLFV